MITKELPIQSNTSSNDPPSRKRGRVWWLIPKPFDLATSLLYLAVLIPYLYSFVRQKDYTPPIAWWQAALMLVTTIALLAVDRIEYFFYGERTPPRSAIFFLLTRIALIEVLSWLDRIEYTPFLYLILPFLACMYFGELAGYGMVVLVWIANFVQHIYYNPDWLSNGTEVHYLVLFTVGLTLVITMAHVVLKEQASRTRAEELFAELEVSHRQLKEYAGQVAELATTKERNRLARDIHDTLGHFLTVINVQLEKALAYRDKKPQEADQAIGNAKRLASEALRDVRRSVGTLRTNEELPEFTLSLNELVEHVQSEICTVELHIKGDEKHFSKQVLQALYRAVQEGLTNVQKHAHASHVWIDLRFEEQAATLVQRDNGRGFDATNWQQGETGRNGGYGLQGVQERMELVGGNLQVESASGQGTTLRVTIPRNEHALIDSGQR